MGSIAGLVLLAFLVICPLNTSVVVERASTAKFKHVFRAQLLSLMNGKSLTDLESVMAQSSKGKHSMSIKINTSPPPLSNKGLNTKSYDKFTFNTEFNKTNISDAPQYIYDAEADNIRSILDFLDSMVLVGKNISAYDEFAEILKDSFKNEQGAVFYSLVSDRWVFCAWIAIFEPTVYMRLCASLISFKLDDVDRDPEEGKDYVETVKIKDMIYNGTVVEIENELLHNDTQEMGHTTARQSDSETSVIHVDLTGDKTTYEEICLDNQNNIHSDCYAFCCNSLYVGSTFCTTFPYNCI